MEKKIGEKIAISFILLGFLILLGIIYPKITGNLISEEHTIGPSEQEQECMMQCMGCSSPSVGCTGNQEQCMIQCNAKPPEMNEEEVCVSNCVKKGCGEYDFSCQSKNQDACDKECGMIKQPEAKSEEEQCIRDCVNLHSPETICKPSQEGEQGNDVCKMCAEQCVHLYEGPCLNDEQIREKEKECMTCEHCYGETIMGDSGEGWECIVNVECKDASSEFGDSPGSGEGVVSKVGETIENIFEGIGNFFSNLFGERSDSEADEEKSTN